MLEDKGVQWMLTRLDKWADIDLMNVNKTKCKVLHLAWNNLIQHSKLADGCVENSFAEELGDQGILWTTKWTWAKVALWQQRQKSACHAVLARQQWAEGSDPSPQFSTCGTESGVLCPALGSPRQEKHWPTGASPAKDQQDSWGLQQERYKERLNKLHLFSLKMKWRGLGRTDYCLWIPGQRIQMRWSQILLAGAQQ